MSANPDDIAAVDGDSIPADPGAIDRILDAARQGVYNSDDIPDLIAEVKTLRARLTELLAMKVLENKLCPHCGKNIVHLGWRYAAEESAVVEALRERVAEMLPYEKACLAVTDWCTEHDRSDITGSVELIRAIEAAEARVVELAGTLEDCAELVNLWASKAGCQTEDAALKSDAEDFGSISVLRRARTVLAAPPAEALERARAVKEVVKAARSIAGQGNYLHPEGELRKALAKLDTLDKKKD